MDRRFFLQYLGCGCLTIGVSSCTSVPITDRKQLKIIPEANLNAQAAQIYEKVKQKEKLSDDINQLNQIQIISVALVFLCKIYKPFLFCSIFQRYTR